MKFLALITLSIAAIVIFSNDYELDFANGIYRFSSEDSLAITINREFAKVNNFIAFELKREPHSALSDNAIIYPVAFNFKNKLPNGELLIVKKRLVATVGGRDGQHFDFYFYQEDSLAGCTDILDNDLGLKGKYEILQYMKRDEYVWLELHSKFIEAEIKSVHF